MVQDFSTVAALVAANNKCNVVSNELVIAIIWKESGFDDAIENTASTATGLMQLTKGAVDEVNRLTPAGVHFDFSNMTDAALNIQCGTYYLDILYGRFGENLRSALNHFGTGPGYAVSLLTAEACLKAAKGQGKLIDPVKAKACLFGIHR